tara:strand:+ start:1240 stop:1704 length:465 start_codon:yes stop_codon:yes gene_type:complete
MIKFGFVNLIKKSYFLLILIFLVQCTSQGEEIILKDYEWVDRILLIYSKNPEFVDAQLEYLNQPNELIERDLVVIYIENEKFKISSDGLKTINTLDNESINNITNKFFLKEESRILLLGKDGLIKISSDNILNSKYIYEIIDEMPMRKLEINQK